MKKIRYVLLASSFSLTSCATLTHEGERVRVTHNPEVVRDCKFIKNVKASSGWEEGTGEDQVEIKMQNETAKAGGNVLYVSQNLGAKVFFSRGSGEAYKCN